LHRVEPASEQARQLREDMARTAQELSGSLDHAVWAVKPENDTLENLVSFLAAYAPSFMQLHGVECELDLPSSLPPTRFRGELRQHIFLAVNEALTNVAKHSRAQRVWLRVAWNGAVLEIEVEDDGCGLAENSTHRPGAGNGLRNLRERMSALGGRCDLTPRTSGGTRLALRVPVSFSG
jgi:signal transduction histidine kinase